MSTSSDPGRGPLIMGVLWTLMIIAVVVVSARLWVRKKLSALSWDDWLMLAATVLQLVDMGFVTKAYQYGLGKHDADLTFDELVNALKWGWLWMIPGTFVAVLGRVSSAIFLVRLFGTRAWFKWYLILFTTLQCVGGAVVLLVQFLGVTPVEALWNPTVDATRMDPKIALIIAYTVQGIFTLADITYVLFPVLIIWRLHMALTRRIALIILMCASLITAAASILKATNTQTVSASLTEPQYAASLAALWSGIEQILVIIMASVPPLRALATIDFPALRSVSSSLASLLGRHGSGGSKKHSAASGESIEEKYNRSNGYSDLERNTYGEGHMHTTQVNGQAFGTQPGIAPVYFQQGSTQDLMKNEAHSSVRRTDQFIITYEN